VAAGEDDASDSTALIASTTLDPKIASGFHIRGWTWMAAQERARERARERAQEIGRCRST
jgi:hypothetical protein